jgi:acetoin utilization deacetylase AcuC-like enzyme
MAMQPLILMSDERCLEHATWGVHPETRERVTAVCARLRACPLGPALVEEQPRLADWAALLQTHDEEYLLRFEEAALSGREWFGHRDNQLGEGSYRAALVEEPPRAASGAPRRQRC